MELSLCLIHHHAMKTYGIRQLWHYALLTSTLDGGELSASSLGVFASGEKFSGTNCIGDKGRSQRRFKHGRERFLSHFGSPTPISQPWAHRPPESARISHASNFKVDSLHLCHSCSNKVYNANSDLLVTELIIKHESCNFVPKTSAFIWHEFISVK
jgi:hypothetical protein